MSKNNLRVSSKQIAYSWKYKLKNMNQYICEHRDIQMTNGNLNVYTKKKSKPASCKRHEKALTLYNTLPVYGVKYVKQTRLTLFQNGPKSART